MIKRYTLTVDCPNIVSEESSQGYWVRWESVEPIQKENQALHNLLADLVKAVQAEQKEYGLGGTDEEIAAWAVLLERAKGLTNE